MKNGFSHKICFALSSLPWEGGRGVIKLCVHKGQKISPKEKNCWRLNF